MADQIGRDDGIDRGGIPRHPEGPEQPERTEYGDPAEHPERMAGPEEAGGLSAETGSPLGTDPQEATPLPGDPREPQQPQEPRSSHIAPGRTGEESHPSWATDRQEGDEQSDQGVVDHLRDAWDRMRGKKK